MTTQVKNTEEKELLATRLSPCQSIKKFCLECAGGHKAVRSCTQIMCSLFHFRLGKNPLRQGIGGKPYHKLAWYLSGTLLSVHTILRIDDMWEIIRFTIGIVGRWS